MVLGNPASISVALTTLLIVRTGYTPSTPIRSLPAVSGGVLAVVLKLTGAAWDIITGGEEKVFDPDAAANAIQILQAAGLDVSRNAVWKRDREEICWNLLADDDELWSAFREDDPEGLGRRL